MHTYTAERCWVVAVRKEIRERASAKKNIGVMENQRRLSNVASAKSERWIRFISSEVSPIITDAQCKYAAVSK